MIFLTEKQLKDIALWIKDSTVAEFVPHLNATMAEFEINNKLRISAFIAQLCHESGNFRYMQEIASGDAYTNRKDLGNLEPVAIEAAKKHGMETGPFYKGHGPIQITGYYNHMTCGAALGLDLVNNPMLLIQPEHGCRAAGWFWNTRKLNALADLKDFKLITKRINGGYNHLAERTEIYLRALKVL